MIHVNQGATSVGIFSEEEVREGLRSGRFAPTDIGWREGMANWQPLSQFSEFAPSGGLQGRGYRLLLRRCISAARGSPRRSWAALNHAARTRLYRIPRRRNQLL